MFTGQATAASLPCPPSRTQPNLINHPSFAKETQWIKTQYHRSIAWDEVPGPRGVDTAASPVVSLTTRCTGNAAADAANKNNNCRGTYYDSSVSGYIFDYAGHSDIEAGTTYIVSIYAKVPVPATQGSAVGITRTPAQIKPYTQCAQKVHYSSLAYKSAAAGAGWVKLSWDLAVPSGSLCKSISFTYYDVVDRLYLVAPNVVKKKTPTFTCDGACASWNMLHYPNFAAPGAWDVYWYNEKVTWNEIEPPAGVDAADTAVIGVSTRRDNINAGYVQNPDTQQRMVRGKSYTASVWAKTSKPAGAVHVSVYTGSWREAGQVVSQLHPVRKADGWVLLEWSFLHTLGSDAAFINFRYRDLPNDERLYLTTPALREAPLNLIHSPSFSSDAWTKESYNRDVTYNEVDGPPCAPGEAVLGVATKCEARAELDCALHEHRGYVTGYNNPTTAPLVAGGRYTVTLWVQTNKEGKEGGPVLVRPVNLTFKYHSPLFYFVLLKWCEIRDLTILYASAQY